ncbi:MAG TPA: amidohydrolase [Cryomorphaceae bacterium]|nr:amidohydrolase [Cryomorphaceae bacterium]
MRNLSHTFGRFVVYNLALLLGFSQCSKPVEYDMVIYNVKIPTEEGAGTRNWIGVSEGKIAAMGSMIANDKPPRAKDSLNLPDSYLYPGFIDAHGHLFGYAEMMTMVNLVGAKSKEECLERIEKFIELHPNNDWIIGRGWDQNDWCVQEFPKSEDLLPFTGIKIFLTRIDGHAAWVNQPVLDAFNISNEMTIEGGAILDGILVDNAQQLVTLPSHSSKWWRNVLLQAQDSLVKYGITAMTDAGLNTKKILILDSLQNEGKFGLMVNAMISNTEEDLSYFESHGPILKDLLRVKSVKAYLDGALGSRGALLRAPYHDLPEHYGLPLLTPSDLDLLRDRCLKNDWQLCVHAIGDSAHHILLESFNSLDREKDLRFRVEHAQIMTPEDSSYYTHPNIIASVQPTHATSDMYWAEELLGHHRMSHAYSYKRILNASGLLALGTDFPIEQVNPLNTFFAAVDRMDKEHWPAGGFNANQKLSPTEAIEGMTYGAAYSAFGEELYGSIKIGQRANFTVLNQDLYDSSQRDRGSCKVVVTILSGRVAFKE